MATDVKKTIRKQKSLHQVIVPVYNALRRRRGFSSGTYWKRRYIKGGNSGSGSYGKLAEYKAEVLNNFVKTNKVDTVIEFGCGDGNQLEMFRFKSYIGLDISPVSISTCIKQHGKDKNRSFYLYDQQCFHDNHRLFSADLTLSLDVVYHLVEDDVFDKYMRDLFAASNKYVIVYASNTDERIRGQAQHVRHRKFTSWVTKNEKSWKLLERIPNRYDFKADGIDEFTADFYVFKKTHNK